MMDVPRGHVARRFIIDTLAWSGFLPEAMRMIVYNLQPCDRGWHVLRNGRPLAQYASPEKALDMARHLAAREKACQGIQTEVHPIAVITSQRPAA
jgi:hypothetical protein